MIMRTPVGVRRALGFLVVVVVVLAGSACERLTGPKPSSPVAVQLAARASAASGTATSAAPLAIASVRLVAGAASFGSGDQFGCVDCQGDGAETASPQQLVSVPLDGSTVTLATEQVNVGRYGYLEISIEAPNAATVAADPSWPAGSTILIAGRYNGAAFTLPLTITGSFVEILSPPVDVTTAAAGSGTQAVRITLPVASWFVSNGVSLDPAVPSQRAQIVANARAAIHPPEAAEASRSPER
jgi:hypothetical protein